MHHQFYKPGYLTHIHALNHTKWCVPATYSQSCFHASVWNNEPRCSPTKQRSPDLTSILCGSPLSRTIWALRRWRTHRTSSTQIFFYLAFFTLRCGRINIADGDFNRIQMIAEGEIFWGNATLVLVAIDYFIIIIIPLGKRKRLNS